jgi:hypothetical protein
LLRFCLLRRRLPNLGGPLDRGATASTGHRLPFEHATRGLLDRRGRRRGKIGSRPAIEPHHDLIAGRQAAIFSGACENIAGLRA